MIRQFTASGLVVTPQRDKALLIWHNKLQAWFQPGGHVDPNEQPCAAALREVEEETGLKAKLLCSGVHLDLAMNEAPERQLATPYCILEEDIPANKKENAHKHLDMIYLMEHEEVDPPAISAREIGAFRWVTREESKDMHLFKGVRKLLESVLV